MKNENGNLKVISHIAVLILSTILVVSSTVSWYDRTPINNGKSNVLQYSQSAKVNNGSNIKVETFAGTNDNGVVTYSETPLSTGNAVVAKSGTVNYFKTVLTDQSNYGDSIVSLYLDSLACSSNMNKALHVGIIGPEKICKPFVLNDDYVVGTLCIEDNILVSNNASQDTNLTTTEVYWFVQVDGTYSGDGVLTLGEIYTVAN